LIIVWWVLLGPLLRPLLLALIWLLARLVRVVRSLLHPISTLGMLGMQPVVRY